MTTYKIMLGMLWTVRNCRTKSIVKIDDNSFVDLARLSKTLDQEDLTQSIVCPSVMRGVRIWRHPEAPLLGKWAVNKSVWPAATYVDHCNGWLWATSPIVAEKLASVATILPKAVPRDGSILDDTLITGFLRSHLPGVQVTFFWTKRLISIGAGCFEFGIKWHFFLLAFQVKSLDTGFRGWIWDKLLSHCSLLGFLKNVFLNDFVLEKSVGRDNNRLSYVNSPRFAGCVFLEEFVFNYLKPMIGVSWDVSKWCHR